MQAGGWVQALAIVGPLIGVYVGSVLGRGAARQAFTRDRAITEVLHRRQHYAAFQKALWAYASRVKVALDLADGLVRERAAGRADVVVRYDIVQTKQRQEACRDAFADLSLFASTEAQVAAREAMEALTMALEATRQGQPPTESAAIFARYEAAFTRFATAVNDDLAHLNTMLYAFVTPVWRALLAKVRSEPLPFEVVSPPADFTDPTPSSDEEGVGAAPPNGPRRLSRVPRRNE